MIVCYVNSHNQIRVETLLSVANEIIEKQCRRIVKLDLTYNLICAHAQPEIQRRFSKIAKSVHAPSLFPSVQ